jgi:hypothetical protein
LRNVSGTEQTGLGDGIDMVWGRKGEARDDF